MRIILVTFALFCTTALPLSVHARPAPGIELRPLSPEAVANALTLGAPVASPDGKWIVYSVSDPHRQEAVSFTGQEYAATGFPLVSVGGVSLRVYNVASEQTIELIGTKGSTWGSAWSPNSRYLAFYSDRTGRATLWVWDSATGKSRQVSEQIVHPFFRNEVPVWSANSKDILVKLLPQGMTLDEMLRMSPDYPTKKIETTNLNKTSVTVYAFNPVVQNMTTGISNVPDVSEIIYANERFLSDLAIVNVISGSIKRVGSHSRVVWYTFLPNNRAVVYMQMQGQLANTQQLVFKLRMISLISGMQRTLVKQMFADSATGVSCSPDSKYLAYQTAGQKADNSLYLLDIAQGISTKLAGPLRGVTAEAPERAALWASDGKTVYTIDELTGKLAEIAVDDSGISEIAIPGATVLDIYRNNENHSYWSPDGGRSMIVQTRNDLTKRETFCRLDLQMRQCTAVFGQSQSMSLGAAPTIGKPTTVISYLGHNAFDPGSVWVTDARLTKGRRLSNTNASILQATLGTTEVIDFTSLNGEHCHAALMLPANYVKDKRYPLVLRVYGGDMGSNRVNSFGFGSPEFNMQLLASRGYAVLDPDIPIHTERHNPVQDVYDAVMPAIDRVIAMGIADPNKIGIMGQSFGGYNTIALITQSTRFAAAVATSPGQTDLFEGYAYLENGIASWTSYYETGQGDMGCTPWECRDRYLSNSPFFSLDKVRTPLLLERGADDSAILGGEDVFIGLRRLGKEVTLLEYANEDHVLERPADIIDFWQKTIDFLNKHLKP